MLPKISIVTVISIVVLGMVLTYATAGFVSISEAIPSTNRALASSGSIRTLNVGVYSDYACSQSLGSINWGDLLPGESVNRTIYVKNTGSGGISLSMSTTGWSPAEANGPLTLVWNREATKLNAGEVVAATLTLHVSESITNIATFSVQILISGFA
jgi:archaellin